MRKSTYLGQCQVRHATFRKDLLAFHRQFPRLFKRSWEHASVSAQAISKWAQDRFEFVELPSGYLVVMPRTFNSLYDLSSMEPILCAHRMGYGNLLLPADGESYFLALGISSSTWQQAWTAMCHKWPKVYEPFLQYCHLSDLHRPPLLVPSEPFSQDAWVEQTSDAAHIARLMIPIYEDTTLEEVTSLWRQIQHLKEWVYREPEESPETNDDEQEPDHQGSRPARRQRPDQYQIRLAVWDAYEKFRNFADVARSLNRPRSTVKGVYLQVSRDIYGSRKTPPRMRQSRLLDGFDPATHMQHCQTCQRASTAEQLCARARAYCNQDERAQRERLHAPEQLDRLQRGRSRVYADES